MNRDRLSLAITALQNVPPERFDLESWVSHRGNADPDNYHTGVPDDVILPLAGKHDPASIKEAVRGACNTAACAAGWLALDDRLHTEGLHLRALSTVWADRIQLEPQYLTLNGWAAVREFFGLNNDQAKWLFADSAYPDEPRPTPADVADRIRFLLDKDPAPHKET